MKKILFLLLVSGCGQHRVVTSGEITITHRIDLAVEWFNEYCRELTPDDLEAQEKCVNELTAQFLKTLGDVK